MTVKTREGQAFLTINGIQTMSAQTYNLLAEVPELCALQVDVLRISPQPDHMPEIIAAFDRARQSQKVESRAEWGDEGFANGFWHGEAGMMQKKQKGESE